MVQIIVISQENTRTTVPLDTDLFKTELQVAPTIAERLGESNLRFLNQSEAGPCYIYSLYHAMLISMRNNGLVGDPPLSGGTPGVTYKMMRERLDNDYFFPNGNMNLRAIISLHNELRPRLEAQTGLTIRPCTSEEELIAILEAGYSASVIFPDQVHAVALAGHVTSDCAPNMHYTNVIDSLGEKRIYPFNLTANSDKIEYEAYRVFAVVPTDGIFA